MIENLFEYDSVMLEEGGNALKILDQTRLPSLESFITLKSESDFIDAVVKLKVRGAPAIGICAAYGIGIILKNLNLKSIPLVIEEFKRIKNSLSQTRPTAVNLTNALDRIERRFNEVLEIPDISIEGIYRELLTEADAIKKEDILSNLSIAKNGLTLLKPGYKILTHCNAGHLAVSRYGTALAPVYLAKSLGWDIEVFACETRPLLQGARLTAFELTKSKIYVTLLCDNMVSSLMSAGEINAVITGCDRIALNGDTANKIGTSAIAIMAKYYKVPFYIAGPSTTIDKNSVTGDNFVIEQRSPDEVTDLWYSERMAPVGVKVYNPAFDITKAELISAIITEKGIFKFPFDFQGK